MRKLPKFTIALGFVAASLISATALSASAEKIDTKVNEAIKVFREH